MKKLLWNMVFLAIVVAVIMPLIRPVFIQDAHADPGDGPNCVSCK
jgi:hypothetical protein